MISDGISPPLLGSSEDVSILCAGQAYGGGVNYGHQFLYVFHQHSVEQPLIPLLDTHQVDVPGGQVEGKYVLKGATNGI